MSQHGVLTTNVYLLLLNLALRLEVFGTVNVHDWLNRPSRITLFINTRNSYGLIKDNIASRGLSRLAGVQLWSAFIGSTNRKHVIRSDVIIWGELRITKPPYSWRQRDAIANNPARARSLGNVLTSHNTYSFAAKISNIKSTNTKLLNHLDPVPWCFWVDDIHGWMICHTYRCAAGQADDSRVTRVSSPYVPPLNEVAGFKLVACVQFVGWQELRGWT